MDILSIIDTHTQILTQKNIIINIKHGDSSIDKYKNKYLF